MTRSLLRPLFLASAGAILAALFSPPAVAGPDAAPATRTVTRQKTVVTWQKKVVDHVLIACGVVEPPPVYVAPGYLETTGPSPMLLYRSAGPMRPRRVAAHPADTDEKPAAAPAAPAASPSPASPVANPASAPAPVVPVPEPLPAGPEPGLLPDGTGGNPGNQSRTDELLSYFQRQHPTARPNNNPLPLPGNDPGPNDPGAEPSFLQAPQAPEQPVLPPSRATYHVAP